MSQAARNTRERESETQSSRPSNGYHLAGIVFFLMVIGTIVWGGWMTLDWMKDSNRLALSKLVLTGERHYTTNDDVRRAIMAFGAIGTFMTQDVNIIQGQIERLPWIRQVTVRKQWPDELKIHLVEYVPYVRWNDTHMLDVEGNVFSLPIERSVKRHYAMLSGPEGKEKEVLAEYNKVAPLFTEHKMKLKTVIMTERNAWQLILDNDIRLELGNKNDVKRIKRFIELYPVLQKNTEKRVAYVDLRYDSGAAVGWAPLLIDAPVSINGQKNNSDWQ
ncbi:cell division protein FtsQ [Xenorhabdus bovienii]|uniref:Cell division protein FtsQ n=3 Tax=Xenorhabdus bovienii TaxID=40576 RepID=A0A0B6XFR5_XENBV|nr:cell division protein FtsQ [Xenorhabdus bovienii]MCG3469258.1 cell division protein FtsQ [Xenorhabdus bovienii]CDG89211.1 cell division protein; ingrowth of wall at septum [Xenorhabdus bovienii str. feltiae France]CDG94895.1 cell division protein; ingrowth of wall at septum [Xenorhabdus bovienii str. feltiae Florida]CDG98780.1 cell division protein; ingrowth of wall at septum [Xenorhabdus bovienii str. puntauvense]CDG99661.1 cell division protein; ingrowth of wall at septum [Xenorhabdus bov